MAPPKKSQLFLPYQEAWIRDTSHIKIMEKSRQIGMSWASAYAAVRRQSLDGSQNDTWVSSRDETQAKLFLEDCMAFSNILNLAAPVLEADTKNTAYTLTFKNKRRIHSMSSNPDAQAGKRGSRILDEFALHPDPRKLYSIASPGTTWGGQIEIISTHRGEDNFFNQLIQEARENGNPKNISLHRVTLEDALNQGFLKKLQEKLPTDDPRQEMTEEDYFSFVQSTCPDEETFLQEYMCTPCSSNSSFIDYDLLTKNTYSHQVSYPLPAGEYFLGVDLGRTNDCTVMWLIEHINGIYLTRDVICLQNTPFKEQEDVLNKLLKSPYIVRTAIDQSGLGRQFTERAIERFGSTRVEGVSFTSQTQEALAYPVKTALEAGSFKILDDAEIRNDFRAIRKEITPTGNIRFSADRTSKGHADRFWAAALALCATQHITFHHYEPLNRNALMLL